MKKLNLDDLSKAKIINLNTLVSIKGGGEEGPTSKLRPHENNPQPGCRCSDCH
ncbi:hypothetical protein [Aureibacter tunicatorum]|uniref:Uncharacterized protein n=1 Tax=Aureibacter tunicatorum TaxID=866807 RepID=A0AAE4BR86_9BACT|nr:hypothetical protein [Aureibacter tunicatorum]MDR6237688.1 hypothetical protein [Aureibacter tunicatorum]BDD02723.1 hypothetical protein AUTU_02060 [Aureibacter tunicatorum]